MATENSTSSGWTSILDKALDVAGDVLGANMGVPTSQTPQPLTNSATSQPAAAPAATIGGIPQWAVYTGVGILAIGGMFAAVSLARR